MERARDAGSFPTPGRSFPSKGRQVRSNLSIVSSPVVVVNLGVQDLVSFAF